MLPRDVAADRVPSEAHFCLLTCRLLEKVLGNDWIRVVSIVTVCNTRASLTEEDALLTKFSVRVPSSTASLLSPDFDFDSATTQLQT